MGAAREPSKRIGTLMYRKNAVEGAMDAADRESFWRGTWKQTLMRSLLIFTIGMTIAFGYAICWRYQHPAPPAPPPPPPECQDSAQIIQSPSEEGDKRSVQICSPGARVDTTRLRQGNYTSVLVRCFCSGHEKLASEQ
jgi:hypothetical protein